MHVAIGLWGLLRALQFTITSIQDQILLPLTSEGHTYEIFIHTYTIQGVYQSSRNHEVGTVLNTSSWQLLNPHYVYVENQEHFDINVHYELFQSQGDPWHNNFTSFRNHMRALNSLYHVTLAMEQASLYRHYDAVLFIRPDVEFLQPLPIRLLSHPHFYQPSTLLLPDFHRSCHSGEYNDRMALGSLSAGLIYGKKMESAFQFSLQHPLHAEKFTYYHLQYYHIHIEEIPFRFRRIRSNGETHKRDYEIISPKQQDKYIKKGIVYTGKVQPTAWYLRWFYNFLEFITFYQVYIWNHDDNGNLYCDPHHKLANNELKQFYKDHPMKNRQHLQDKANELQQTLTHRMYCKYHHVVYPTPGNAMISTGVTSRLLKPAECKIVLQGQGNPYETHETSTSSVGTDNSHGGIEGGVEDESVGALRQKHRNNHSHPRTSPHAGIGESKKRLDGGNEGSNSKGRLRRGGGGSNGGGRQRISSTQL